MSYVAAVVVTMRRPRELERLLSALEGQERRPDLVILVENTPDDRTVEVVRRHPDVRHLVSRRNIGGAGGFAYGILTALAEGATHVWLMDDDGRPETSSCLGDLFDAMETERADLVSPVIVDIDDPERLAFPYVSHGRRLATRGDLDGVPVIEQFAHLFNGALVRADAFMRFGIPDLRLFFRGDEVDFLHRLRRGGGRVLTLPRTGFLHPSGRPETVPLLGGRLNAVVPPGDFKQFYFYRNRGYLVRQHRLWVQALNDLIRYPYYFLVTRRGDWSGLAHWLRLTSRGARQDFRPFDEGAHR